MSQWRCCVDGWRVDGLKKADLQQITAEIARSDSDLWPIMLISSGSETDSDKFKPALA